jgi:hypothetical protein
MALVETNEHHRPLHMLLAACRELAPPPPAATPWLLGGATSPIGEYWVAAVYLIRSGE